MSGEANVTSENGEHGSAPASRADVRKMVEEVTRMLVDQPDQVEVVAEQEGRETILDLYVAPDDLGRIIGRSGRTAKALRSLVSAAADKLDRRYSLEIVEVDEEDEAPAEE
jgi:predicted RNA-binding protein YlqC (UPF0109 family)